MNEEVLARLKELGQTLKNAINEKDIEKSKKIKSSILSLIGNDESLNQDLRDAWEMFYSSAVKEDDTIKMALIESLYPDIVEASDSFTTDLIRTASSYGSIHALSRILDNFKGNKEELLIQNSYALERAVQENHGNIVEMFLDNVSENNIDRLIRSRGNYEVFAWSIIMHDHKNRTDISNMILKKYPKLFDTMQKDLQPWGLIWLLTYGNLMQLDNFVKEHQDASKWPFSFIFNYFTQKEEYSPILIWLKQYARNDFKLAFDALPPETKKRFSGLVEGDSDSKIPNLSENHYSFYRSETEIPDRNKTVTHQP